MHLLTIASLFFLLKQYYLTAFQMLIVIAMSEMFQQCLQERKDEKVLQCMKTCDAFKHTPNSYQAWKVVGEVQNLFDVYG